jgi:hypothetical protein
MKNHHRANACQFGTEQQLLFTQMAHGNSGTCTGQTLIFFLLPKDPLFCTFINNEINHMLYENVVSMAFCSY